MNEWQLKGCYLSQTATVRKLLREGWEPFWGYRCAHKEKKDVRMYFRLAPAIEVVASETMESEPPVVQIDPISLQSLSNIINQLNTTFDQAMLHAGKILIDQNLIDPEPEIAEESLNGAIDLSDEEVEADSREMEERERAAPRGEDFRVVDDVPPLPVRQRTPAQEKAIDEVRRTAGTNITIGPVDENGRINILAGEDIIVVYADGRTKSSKNPANRTSLI